MSSALLARPLSFVLRILVPAVIVFLLLNFLYVPSCGRFSCSYSPAWWPQAHAGAENCPDSIGDTLDNAEWAAARYSEIADQHITTGVFFDEDGQRHTFSSGDERGGDAVRAREALRFVGAPTAPDGSYPAATHVELKVAALMRAAEVTTGVLVINRDGGSCVGSAGLSCRESLPLVLPPGATLRVWFPDPGQPMEFDDFHGR